MKIFQINIKKLGKISQEATSLAGRPKYEYANDTQFDHHLIRY